MSEAIEVPKYVVQEKSLIGNELHEAGAIVEYDGLPAGNLKPTCKEGERRAAEYVRSNAERVRKMQAEFTESGVGDPTVFAAAMAKANAEMMAGLPALIGAAVAEGIASAMAAARAEYQPAPASPDTPTADAAAGPTADAKVGKGKDKATDLA